MHDDRSFVDRFLLEPLEWDLRAANKEMHQAKVHLDPLWRKKHTPATPCDATGYVCPCLGEGKTVCEHPSMADHIRGRNAFYRIKKARRLLREAGGDWRTIT